MFNQMLKDKVAHIETIIERYLPVENDYNSIVKEAMNYSVNAKNI